MLILNDLNLYINDNGDARKDTKPRTIEIFNERMIEKRTGHYSGSP